MRKWKPVVGFESLYEVSNDGLVRSIERTIDRCDGVTIVRSGKIMRQVNHKGYARVQFHIDYVRYRFFVHQLVAKMFIKNPRKLKDVNHKDCDKLNNYYKNLEWCTSLENNKHAAKNNRFKQCGDLNNGKKITHKKVLKIRQLCASGKYSRVQIANMFGLSKNHITRIKLHQSWISVK